MCGRASLAIPPEQIQEILNGLGVHGGAPWYTPRYNIAPSQDVMVVVDRGKAHSERVARAMRWGLVPFWAKDARIGNKMVNARCETVAEKPAYREAFKRRRGLMIVDSYYEWRREPTGPKTPFRIHREDGRPFAIAALWERWKPAKDAPEEDVIESCTVVTRAANETMSAVHDRMPVIVSGEAVDAWLDRDSSANDVAAVVGAPIEGLTSYPVSHFVNAPANDSLVCWEPASP